MKTDVHPDHHPVVFRDPSTGDAFLTRSTVTSSRTIEWADGQTYPVVDVEISSSTHPLWAGSARPLATGRAGREVTAAVRLAVTRMTRRRREEER